jgi:hypothetical protein
MLRVGREGDREDKVRKKGDGDGERWGWRGGVRSCREVES